MAIIGVLPGFPAISGPPPPWPGGLGLDSGMALSSGASGAAGFAAFGTAGNKKTHTQTQPWQAACTELQWLGKDYFLLSFDMSFIRREGYRCMCWKCLRSKDESAKRRKDKLENVCETRQYSCPVIKNELTSTLPAPSANTQTGISNTDTFMRA